MCKCQKAAGSPIKGDVVVNLYVLPVIPYTFIKLKNRAVRVSTQSSCAASCVVAAGVGATEQHATLLLLTQGFILLRTL